MKTAKALFAFVAIAAACVWLVTSRPEVRFLAPHAGAEWIVAPVPVTILEQPVVARVARFERSFSLTRPPRGARLAVRALGHVEVTVNGRAVELPPVSDSKVGASVDVLDRWDFENTVSVTVTEDQAPPALWLSISTLSFQLGTDASWTASIAGSSPRPARLAAASAADAPRSPSAVGERTPAALRSVWPTLLLFTAIVATLVVAAFAAARGRAPSARTRLALVLVAWSVLFLHNLRALPEHIGFNAEQHLAYVDYVRERLALPLANEGWEMHQPPLYYAFGALVTALAGRAASVGALRLLALVAALIHVAFVDACLRRLFPSRTALQIVGLVLVAFLPLHLVLQHYVANDLFAAAFSSAGVYVLLRILERPASSIRWFVALGVCIGGAILSKLTAFAPALAIIVVLAGRLAPLNGRSPARWARSLGVVALIAAGVSGFFFVRAWVHFGHPFVTSFDPASGFAWWQDPGYSTASYWTRFGDVWTRPFHAELGSFFDGLASTSFGDGTWAGSATTAARPPWNYSLMAAGYALALVPAALVLVGAVVAIARWSRRPTAAWSALIAIAFFTIAASIYQFLRFPYFCHVKASYGVGAVVALAAFGVVGFEVLSARGRAIGALLGVALGVWSATAYASMWVRADAPATLTYLAGRRFADKDLAGADALYRRALDADGLDLDAALGLARTEVHLGNEAAAFTIAARTVRDHPESSLARRDLAVLEARRGDADAARVSLGEAIRLAPEDPGARQQLGLLLASQGSLEESVAALRDALALAPSSAETHALLALDLARLGATDEAAEHRRMVELLQAQHEKNARSTPRAPNE